MIFKLKRNLDSLEHYREYKPWELFSNVIIFYLHLPMQDTELGAALRAPSLSAGILSG